MPISVKTRPIPLNFVVHHKRRHIEKQLILFDKNIFEFRMWQALTL
jgi:hypothetical protein